jgi:nucleoside-diphosphate-sugar epimerase
MNKRALVTGATGFVGSHLVRGLLEAGWDVSVIVRERSKLDMLSDAYQRITVYKYKGDINQLTEAMIEYKPSVVFHVASLFLSSHKPEQINALIESNILFGTQLLEAMVAADVKYLINTSTSWEHYENKEYSPVNLYAATKRAFQDIMQFYIEAKGIKAITLKLFDTYGADDPRPKLLNLLMCIAETGEKLAMSPGEQEIDLVHIDDVIQAYLIAAQRLLDGDVVSHEIYGVGTGQPLTLKELTAMIEKKTGKTLNIKWGGRPYREREVMNLPQKLKPLAGWKPTIFLPQYLEERMIKE